MGKNRRDDWRMPGCSTRWATHWVDTACGGVEDLRQKSDRNIFFLAKICAIFNRLFSNGYLQDGKSILWKNKKILEIFLTKAILWVNWPSPWG